MRPQTDPTMRIVPGSEGVGVAGAGKKAPFSQIRNRVPELRARFWSCYAASEAGGMSVAKRAVTST
jgi:hypothetical protein